MIELKNLEVKVSLYYRNNQAYGNTDCWVFMRGIQTLKNFWIKSTYSKDIIQFYELVLWGGVKQCQNFKVNFLRHKSRTTDPRWGNRLHCTAENQIPIPNVYICTAEANFVCHIGPNFHISLIYALTALGVRSPCQKSSESFQFFFPLKNMKLGAQLSLMTLFV